MWILLAVIAFLAGQVYLFRCLGRMDSFLDRCSMDDTQEKEILSIVFADSNTAERMSKLLEDFSAWDTDIDMILLTNQDVLDAVCDGKAAIGFLSDGTDRCSGLNGMNLTKQNSQQVIVWKSGGLSAPAKVFLQYLRECGAADSGIMI